MHLGAPLSGEAAGRAPAARGQRPIAQVADLDAPIQLGYLRLQRRRALAAVLRLLPQLLRCVRGEGQAERLSSVFSEARSPQLPPRKATPASDACLRIVLVRLQVCQLQPHLLDLLHRRKG